MRRLLLALCVLSASTVVMGQVAITPSLQTVFGILTTTVNSIGTGTDNNGLVLTNTTAAAVGAQQFSPMLTLCGQGWKTNATAGTEQICWSQQTQPVQGAADPTGILGLYASTNGAANVLMGQFSFTTATNSGSFNAATSGQLGFISSTKFFAPANGELTTQNSGGTFNGAIRAAVIVEANTGAKAPGVLENGEWYTNTGDADGSSITLPNDPAIGSVYSVMVTVAQTITITASAGESLRLGTSTCGTSITMATVGQSATFVAATGGSGAIWVTTASAGSPTCNP